MQSPMPIITTSCRQTRRLVRSGLLTGIFTAVLVVSMADVWAVNQKRRPDVETKTLMSDVLELMKTRPLTLQQIEKAFHVKLALDAQNTNEYTQFYSASVKDSPVGLRSIEARFPADAAANKQRMLILSLDPKCGLVESDVRERLGEPNSMQVGRPAAPEGTSYTYQLKTGELRFGILREPKDHVGTIVMVWED